MRAYVGRRDERLPPNGVLYRELAFWDNDGGLRSGWLPAHSCDNHGVPVVQILGLGFTKDFRIHDALAAVLQTRPERPRASDTVVRMEFINCHHMDRSFFDQNILSHLPLPALEAVGFYDCAEFGLESISRCVPGRGRSGTYDSDNESDANSDDWGDSAIEHGEEEPASNMVPLLCDVTQYIDCSLPVLRSPAARIAFQGVNTIRMAFQWVYNDLSKPSQSVLRHSPTFRRQVICYLQGSSAIEESVAVRISSALSGALDGDMNPLLDFVVAAINKRTLDTDP